MYADQAQADPSASSHLVLKGHCGYTVTQSQVVVTIAEIANRRDAGNISGTLAVELWGLAQPYGGGDFNGAALAGTSIGELFGQHFLTDCRYSLSFAEPPAGTWYLSLMLREWTEGGYVTRDHVNFAVPYIAGSEPTLGPSVADDAIDPSVAGEGTSFSSGASAMPVVPAIEAAEPKRGKPSAGASVSLNQASVQEIAAVKGISKKTAENLVAARPYASFDQVSKVKGIGASLLKKVRHFLTL